MPSSEASFPELMIMPVVYIVIAAFSLLSFNNLLKFILSAGKTSNALIKNLQPAAAAVKPWAEMLFGGSFTIKLEHILLAGILAVLIGIYRSVQINNELLADAAKAQKAPATGKGQKSAAATESTSSATKED